MDYGKLTIQKLHQLLSSHQVQSATIIQELLTKIKTDQASNFLLTLADEKKLLGQAQELDSEGQYPNLLSGIPYFAKDNFATAGLRTTAGSKILTHFVPPYDATIIELLQQKGALMAGKVALDELGMGGTGLLSAYGEIYNPYDAQRLVGGSSSGSAYAVSKGYVPFATGTDTGDSIRKPASYTGIVGYKPTYGALSRYGIIPYAPSLDHPGFFTRNVADMAILADATIKFDPKDFTSHELLKRNFYAELNNLPSKTRFGYLSLVQDRLEPGLKNAYTELFQKLKKQGYSVQKLTFPQELLDALPAVYMAISFSEAASTHANLTGINFGERAGVENSDYIEMMRATRTKYLGKVVRRRFLIGSLNLKKENQELFLMQAKKIRRLIVQEIMKLFQTVDVLILPGAPGVAPFVQAAFAHETDFDANKTFLNDVLVLANMTGMPSITVPFVFENGLPIGINLNAAPHEDRLLLQAAQKIENLTGLKNRIAGEKDVA